MQTSAPETKRPWERAEVLSAPAPGPVRDLILDDLKQGHPLKWSWSCRAISEHAGHALLRDAGRAPLVGDVALVRVSAIGHHARIMTAKGGKQRLYPQDLLVAVFGNRYATDAFEGEVRGVRELHMLTDAGMIGTVCSQHRDTRKATAVEFLGFLDDGNGRRLNLKTRLFRPARPATVRRNVLLVVGTGMNSGKTTTGSRLVKSLLRRGVRVAAYKLTGSVCQNDRCEWSATGALDVRDFSDYGFPSTYLAPEDELVGLFETLVADAERLQPDLVVMEIADGILQRETRLLLGHEAIRRRSGGVVLAATCSAAALFGVEQVRALGHEVVAVSGVITNSPLFVREFQAACPIHVGYSLGDCDDLAEEVVQHFAIAP